VTLFKSSRIYLEGGTRSRPCFVKVRQEEEGRNAGTDQSCSFASPKGWVAMIGLRTDASGWGRMKRDGEEEPLNHSLPRRLKEPSPGSFFQTKSKMEVEGQ
jgi:hypothetical protein